MKVQFQIVSQSIDRMYEDVIPTTDEAIAQQCQLVADFIQACGWGEDEFWIQWMSQTETLDNPLAPTYLVKQITHLN